MKTALIFAALIASVAMAHSSEKQEKTVHDALYSETRVVLDGKLDDPVWQKAKAYPLNVAWRFMASHDPLNENGTIRLAWDDHYLYLAADLEDLDLVAEDDQDQAHHYVSGDVMELFLRPPSRRWYWELYGTPHSRKTAFFFPSAGRIFLPSASQHPLDLKVASQMNGTLNQWQDRDKGWTMEMAVPHRGLTALGDIVAEGAPEWHILVARYNYSAYHEIRGGELSTTSPTVENADFHNVKTWGMLRFVKDRQE